MRAWYAGLAERDRRIVTIGAVVVPVIVIAAVLLWMGRGIGDARTRLANKQADLAFIQEAAPQIAGAGAGTVSQVTPDSLVVFIDSSARESGLGKSLTSSQPTGDKGLRIRLDRASFDSLVAWLARLSQQHGVRVESAEIEYAGEAGIVNAGLVLKAG